MTNLVVSRKRAPRSRLTMKTRAMISGAPRPHGCPTITLLAGKACSLVMNFQKTPALAGSRMKLATPETIVIESAFST